MTDYIVLYKGPMADMSKVPEAKFNSIMEAWGVWMEKVGPSLKDIGAPMIGGVSIVDNGSKGSSSDLTGYSILSAESMEDVKKLLNNHPHLSEGKGVYSIDIFELAPIPMDM